MGDNIGGPHCEGTVEHPKTENQTITQIPRFFLPFRPYESVRGVRLMVHLRHNSTDDNSDKNASNNQEAAQRFNGRKRSVRKQNNETTYPYADEVGNEHLPPFVSRNPGETRHTATRSAPQRSGLSRPIRKSTRGSSTNRRTSRRHARISLHTLTPNDKLSQCQP